MDSENNFVSKVSTISRCSISNESLIANTEAKLRRLKIQENLFMNSLNKFYAQLNEDNKLDAHIPKTDTKLKNYFYEIISLYQEIKDTSRNKENLKDSDIIDIKKDVLKMEDKMKILKTLLQNEMTSLKTTELELLAKIDEESLAIIAKKSTKISVKPYSDVMPSPVKAIMHTPARSKEVQEFQDFIAVHGRCGNWLDINHNIFVKVWQKYFNDCKNISRNYYDSPILKSASFPKFLQEVTHKIIGITNEEVLQHIEWYTIFLYLKQRQQVVLNNWKQKRLIKKGKYDKIPKGKIQDNIHQTNFIHRRNSDDKDVYRDSYGDDDVSDCFKSCSESSSQKSIEQNTRLSKGLQKKESRKVTALSLARIMRPTEQWNNKCFGSSDTYVSDFTKVDNIVKLGTPQWRLCLRNE